MPAGTGPTTYTAVTFAPVQSFIRSSRKLRDLYGSSLLLSHLARAIVDDAETRLQPLGGFVISPAGVSLSRGVPNSLILRGAYSEGQARQALLTAWRQVLKACRDWLEANIRVSQFPEQPVGWTGDWEAGWGTSWKAVALHSWELFHGQGLTISAARRALAVSKQQRDWSIPNWTGESSTLSSAEAVVRPTMGRVIDPRHLAENGAKQEARALIHQLRAKLGDAFADENEEISLLELVKRLITYQPLLINAFALQEQPHEVEELLQKGFPHLSTHQPLESAARPESIIWFMADGDRIGTHLDRLANQANEESALRQFSHSIRAWAGSLYEKVPQAMHDPCFTEGERRATVVYAGGDDLLGALHEARPGKQDLSSRDLWRWLTCFPTLWQEARQPDLTISMGLVWATARVPQREALQHARDAEASAKARGRNRFALRLLYASGNHLEWSCPWAWLQPIREHYRDRENRKGSAASWRHLADDLVWLKERQAIAQARSGHGAKATALALWQAYFPGIVLPDAGTEASASADHFHPSLEEPEQGRRFDQWLLDLGLVMAGLEKRRGEEVA
jgi:CRISPR-associated protein Cmr2